MFRKIPGNLSPEEELVHYNKEKERLEEIREALGFLTGVEEVNYNIKDKIRIKNQLQEIDKKIEELKGNKNERLDKKIQTTEIFREKKRKKKI